MTKMAMPSVQLKIRSAAEIIVFQNSAKPAAKYHRAYSFHMMPFSLLYCATSLISAGSTATPDQKCIGFSFFWA